MNLKQFTHALFPYAIVLTLVLATMVTAFWSDPMLWFEQFLAVERYWLSLGVYGLLMAASTILTPLTVAVTVPFMAKIFGPFAIFLVSWIGWVSGALVVFYISRSFGRPLVERLFSMDRITALEQKVPKNLDFWVLLLLRTFIPVDVLSYAVGLFSTINFKKYVLATSIGVVPFAFILSYGPDALTGNNPGLLFVFLLVVFVILAAVAIFHFSNLLRPQVYIYTHDGKFHADDVCAVATIQIILNQQQRRYKVVRTRDEKVLNKARQDAQEDKDVYIVDVGDVYEAVSNQFDHHQKGGAGVRENGIKYAAFGLVWKKYGMRLCENSGEVSEMVDRIFVQALDGPDNGQNLFVVEEEWGVGPVTFCELIEDYYHQDTTSNPLGQASDFAHAVEWIKDLLPLVIARARKRLDLEKQAGRTYSQSTNRKVMISESYIGRNYFTIYPEPLFVVSPQTGCAQGAWSVGVVPQVACGLKGRIAFPTSWHGLRGGELQRASGVSGAKFCHSAGDFICIANSKKAALELVEKTIEHNVPQT